jgi:acyl dehydratase
MSAAPLLYFEDILVGERFMLGEKRVTKEEIIAFATEFDPQPFHIDEEAGRKSFLGGLCASGWHTCALVHRLNCDSFFNKFVSLGSPGGDELRWLKPLFPGDTVTGITTVIDTRASESRPEMGLLQISTEAHNQKNEPLLKMRAWGMIARRLKQ